MANPRPYLRSARKIEWDSAFGKILARPERKTKFSETRRNLAETARSAPLGPPPVFFFSSFRPLYVAKASGGVWVISGYFSYFNWDFIWLVFQVIYIPKTVLFPSFSHKFISPKRNSLSNPSSPTSIDESLKLHWRRFNRWNSNFLPSKDSKVCGIHLWELNSPKEPFKTLQKLLLLFEILDPIS